MTATGRCVHAWQAPQSCTGPQLRPAASRYPPQPFHKPIEFYSAVRLGEPEELAKVMERDPYFVTQDNGAGAPLHFATTYKQLDMVRAAVVGEARWGLKLGCAADAPPAEHRRGDQPAGREGHDAAAQGGLPGAARRLPGAV